MDIRDRARKIAGSGQVATMSDLRLQLSMHGFTDASISAAFRDASFEQEVHRLLQSKGRPKAMLSLLVFVAVVAIGLVILSQLGSHR